MLSCGGSVGIMLCQRCQELHLDECFFPQSSATKPPTSEDTAYLECSQILENAKDCRFCSLLVQVLSHIRPFKSMKIDSLKAMLLSKRVLAEIQWSPDIAADAFRKPNDPFDWIRTRNPVNWIVRHLLVRAVLTGDRFGGDLPLYPAMEKSATPETNLGRCREPENQLDLDLVTGWLKNCQRNHGTKCHPGAWHEMGSSKLRMIDVRKRCIVSIEQEVDYFALSYC